jgi:CheY-like chemotaxis protein
MEKKKVLIAEDDDIIRSLLRMRLTGLGYEVCAMATNGGEAIKLARETKPDFVIMDISMPGETDGITAAEEIKEHSDSRIIFLTAYSADEVLDRIKLIKPVWFIPKPFSDNDLRVALELVK